MTSPTAGPVTGEPVTKGPFAVDSEFALVLPVRNPGVPICMLLWPTVLRSEDETRANGALIAEAMNVHHECGKTPRELLVECERLKAAAYKEFEDYEDATLRLQAAEKQRNALLEECERLREALRLFVAYDDSDPDDGVAFMCAYNDAITAARAALGE